MEESTQSPAPMLPTPPGYPRADEYAEIEAARVAEAESRKEAIRTDVLETLFGLFCSLKNLTSTTLNDDQIAQLKIEVYPLESVENGPRKFFRPSLAEFLQQYPIIRIRGLASRDMLSAAELGHLSRYTLWNQAATYGSIIAWKFSGAFRYGVPKSENGLPISLGEYMGWKFKGGFPSCMRRQEYVDTIFSERPGVPLFRPDRSWERYQDRKEKPHLMFSLNHDLYGEEDLLRGEVLSIVAAMLSRMQYDFFKEHLVIPIQVFSYMGRRGRIIQAYHNGEALVLRKSQLFDFTHFENAPFDFFVQYLASEPVGNTRVIRPKPAEEPRRGILTNILSRFISSEQRCEYVPPPPGTWF